MTTRPAPARPRLTYLPDPPKDIDAMKQSPHIASALVTLRDHFHSRLGLANALVNGNGYLCRNPGEARSSPHPDCLVALNLPIAPEIIEEEANGYTISEIGQPPDFVLEVASETTGETDYTTKREAYANLDVQEYWRFDHTGGRYHDAPLAGDTLVNGRYEPIPIIQEPDGLLWGYSAALNLELCWVQRTLRFRDPVTKQFLPTMAEERERRETAEARHATAEAQRQTAEAQRQTAEIQRQAAEAQREAAEARNRELEAEIRRLRGQ